MVSKHQTRRIQFAIPDRAHNLHTRNEVMKPAYIFRDRINTVVQWFDQWNDIEQTIACYSLLKRLGPTQARFLSLVLEHTFQDSAYEVQIFEEEANAKEFLRGLCHESKEIAVQQLLLHLPLLHPGNDEARHEYLKLLPKILSHSLEYSIHEEECRQLLSLALVHPAFVPEERNSLTWWLGLLDDKGEKMRPPPGFKASMTHSPLSGTKSACELWGNNKPSRHHLPVSNTLSYKPPSMMNGWKSTLTQRDSGISTSFDNGSIGLAYPPKGTGHKYDIQEEMGPRASRSRSFPADPERHMPISPQSSLDSDEDNALRKMNSIIENANPGMKDVPMWLKSLRLHKYAHIFHDLTYENMLGLNDEYLEAHGVTKGARNKIVLCIQKVKERKSTLIQLEKEVLQPGRLPHVLQELKNILMSPIRAPKSTVQTTIATGESEEQIKESESESAEEVKPDEDKSDEIKPSEKETNPDENANEEEKVEEEEDLPSHVSRVMGKACTQILVVSQPDEECCLTYLGLLDRVLSHEAFTQSDKRRLQSWKAQCQKLAKTLATTRKLAGIEKGPKNWYDPFGNGGALGRRRPTNRTTSLKGGSMLHIPVGRAGPLIGTQSMHKKLGPTNSYHTNIIKNHQSLSRTKSAPIRSNVVLQAPIAHLAQQDTDGINKSLETLCLSMTNHALDDEQNNDSY